VGRQRCFDQLDVHCRQAVAALDNNGRDVRIREQPAELGPRPAHPRANLCFDPGHQGPRLRAGCGRRPVRRGRGPQSEPKGRRRERRGSPTGSPGPQAPQACPRGTSYRQSGDGCLDGTPTRSDSHANSTTRTTRRGLSLTHSGAAQPLSRALGAGRAYPAHRGEIWPASHGLLRAPAPLKHALREAGGPHGHS